jgi:hypothetical protein
MFNLFKKSITVEKYSQLLVEIVILAVDRDYLQILEELENEPWAQGVKNPTYSITYGGSRNELIFSILANNIIASRNLLKRFVGIKNAEERFNTSVIFNIKNIFGNEGVIRVEYYLKLYDKALKIDIEAVLRSIPGELFRKLIQDNSVSEEDIYLGTYKILTITRVSVVLNLYLYAKKIIDMYKII